MKQNPNVERSILTKTIVTHYYGVRLPCHGGTVADALLEASYDRCKHQTEVTGGNDGAGSDGLAVKTSDGFLVISWTEGGPE